MQGLTLSISYLCISELINNLEVLNEYRNRRMLFPHGTKSCILTHSPRLSLPAFTISMDNTCHDLRSVISIILPVSQKENRYSAC